MTDKTGSSVMDTSRGTSALLKRDTYKMPNKVYKAMRQAVNNRPYEIFKFKSNNHNPAGNSSVN